jgi:hypothetical protein
MQLLHTSKLHFRQEKHTTPTGYWALQTSHSQPVLAAAAHIGCFCGQLGIYAALQKYFPFVLRDSECFSISTKDHITNGEGDGGGTLQVRERLSLSSTSVEYGQIMVHIDRLALSMQCSGACHCGNREKKKGCVGICASRNAGEKVSSALL